MTRTARAPDAIVDAETLVRRPPTAVYAWLADIQDHLVPGSPVPAMPKTPAGPTAVGTRWDEVVLMGPFRMIVVSTVTGLETGRRLEMRYRGPFQEGDLRYTLEPEGTGTRLHQWETLYLRYMPHALARRLGATWEARVRARLEAVREEIEATTSP